MRTSSAGTANDTVLLVHWCCSLVCCRTCLSYQPLMMILPDERLTRSCRSPARWLDYRQIHRRRCTRAGLPRILFRHCRCFDCVFVRLTTLKPRSARIRVSSRQNVTRLASGLEPCFCTIHNVMYLPREPRLHQFRHFWHHFPRGTNQFFDILRAPTVLHMSTLCGSGNVHSAGVCHEAPSADFQALTSHAPGRQQSSNFCCVRPGTFQYTCSASSTASLPYDFPLMARYGELSLSLTLSWFSNQEARRTTHGTIECVMLISIFGTCSSRLPFVLICSSTKRFATSVAPILADEYFGQILEDGLLCSCLAITLTGKSRGPLSEARANVRPDSQPSKFSIVISSLSELRSKN